MHEAIENLGPLAVLAGVWEGGRGGDTAPSPERASALTKFREGRGYVRLADAAIPNWGPACGYVC